MKESNFNVGIILTIVSIIFLIKMENAIAKILPLVGLKFDSIGVHKSQIDYIWLSQND